MKSRLPFALNIQCFGEPNPAPEDNSEDVKALLKTIEEDEKRIAQLESDKKALESRNQELHDSVEGLKSDVKTLQDSYKEVFNKGSNEDLDEDNDAKKKKLISDTESFFQAIIDMK